MRTNKQEREDFELYLKQCTDAQVRGVYEKERTAGRRATTQLARTEAARRGVALDTPRQIDRENDRYAAHVARFCR